MEHKSYTVYAPVVNRVFERQGREETVRLFRRMGATTIFLALESQSITDGKELTALRDNVRFLHERGFTVGAWLWAFMLHGENGYTHIENCRGEKCESEICPLDEGFASLMGAFIERIAGCGVELIMFDDDYRFGFTETGFGCTCALHRRVMGELLGEDVSETDLTPYLLAGGENRYRDAFVKANGLSLERFAVKMREAVDRVDPDIRLGFCSCITSWDLDGTHPDKIARLLAGKTRPFYRLIGAPYWAALRTWDQRLSSVVEFERVEAFRRKDADIEIFSECDTYPRPRYKVPAAFSEFHDMILRADGQNDGILKYYLDYCAGPGYETGYIDRHEKNLPAYEYIERVFRNKTAVGLRIADHPEKYKKMRIPPYMEGSLSVQHCAFPFSASFAAGLSLPVCYTETDTPVLAFGDDVRALTKDDMKNGVILDAAAAEILSELGTDTGVRRFGDYRRVSEEHFLLSGEDIGFQSCRARELTVDGKAELQSEFLCDGERLPASFYYENGEGLRFFVFAFDGCFPEDGLCRSYERARQLADCSKMLCGRAFPVTVVGCPDLYVMAKRGDETLAVGLWNIFPDDAEPVLTIPNAERVISSFGCEVKLQNGKATVSRMEPYSFAAFEVE